MLTPLEILPKTELFYRNLIGVNLRFSVNENINVFKDGSFY